MKSWIRRITLLGLLLGLAAGTVLYLTANVFFEPERLVHRIEKQLNCRTSISSVDLPLFSQPARLIIRDFAMADRDKHASERTPLADRPPLENPQITAKELALSVSFPHLLIGKIHVHELVGKDVTGKLTKPAEGDHSLDRLFDKPDRKRKKDKSKDNDDDDDDDDDTIDRLKISTAFRSARLENFTFVIELEKKDTRISWTDVNLDLSDVELSPSDLVHKNHAKIALSAQAVFEHLHTGERFGNVVLHGSGVIRPVDPITRKIEPAADIQLTALSGTRVESAPLIDAITDKLGDLKKYGIRLDDVSLGGDLQSPARLSGRYENHQFTLAEPVSLNFENYSIALGEGSWYESEDNEHTFHTTLTAGPSITQSILQNVDRYIQRKVRFLPTDTFQRIIGEFFLKDGQFTLKLTTKGDIGKPRVSFSEKLPDIDVDAVKDSAKDLIKDLKSIFR